jgi:rare lipoprotein A
MERRAVQAKRAGSAGGRRRVLPIALLALGFGWAACASPRPPEPAPLGGLAPYRVNGDLYRPIESWEGFSEVGLASWYGAWHHGRLTASGERFDTYGGLTAAHKTLPFNVCARVQSLESGESVLVRINDRGPFAPGRVIDLSRAAAEALELVDSGLARVRVDAVSRADASGRCLEELPEEPPALSLWERFSGS